MNDIVVVDFRYVVCEDDLGVNIFCVYYLVEFMGLFNSLVLVDGMLDGIMYDGFIYNLVIG